MNTSISESTPCAAATANPAEAFSSAGYSLPRQASPRNSADEERSGDDLMSGSGDQNTLVSSEDARHFEAAMRSDRRRSDSHEKDSSSEQEADSRKKAPHKDEVADDLPFASLFAGRFDAGAVVEVAPQAAPSPSAPSPSEALGQRLAERILVSEPSGSGQEVRIQLSGALLPDTEICLVRGTDGLLSAVIRTDNPAAFQTLAAAQHDLRDRLEAAEGQAVRVELRSSTDDDNDPRRRSRGLDLDVAHE